MAYSDLICVIGGSGFYDFLQDPTEITVPTPFSSESVTLYKQIVDGRTLYFLPRHGGDHSIPPHKINFKANIFALHTLNVTRLLATNAVGSLNPDIKPGDFVILDQFIDFVRPLTFFDGNFSVKFSQGNTLSGVVHVDMTEPYCTEIQEIFKKILKMIPNTHKKGTYAMSMGPRFETPAEIKVFQHMGADVVGMTNSSEAILSRELGICYGAIAVITNYAAGLQEAVNHQEVLDIFASRTSQLKKIFHEVIGLIPLKKKCVCSNHIK
ncbi:MAG: MTAP family purine nucleoside phosphorylase [Candidatus Hodarchaeota archaeon]